MDVFEAAKLVVGIDTKSFEEAKARQLTLTKPPYALGALEDVAAQICGIASLVPARTPSRGALAIFAGDHGVLEEGISPWPMEVTAQMVGNFLSGGAAANVLAKRTSTKVLVVDVGVALDLVPTEGLIIQKVAKGTSNLAKGAAMTREQAAKAIQVGFDVACDLVLDGHDILIAGDMGIGNTTPSAAIVAFMVGAPVASVTGYGTGISSELFEKKVAIIESAVSRTASSIDRSDVLGVLSSIGGFEHGATVGFIIGAAFSKVPLVLDGVISNSSALLARELSPLSLQYCFAGHASREVGAKVANSALGMEPLLNLDLALGEGSGALLALGLIQGATDLLADMATFDQAGVTEK